MALAAGDKLGPYEILAPLGAGGMGEVYRARDTKLKRDVALKVLSPVFAGDPERLARFQREAEVLASLNHPNIAHIYGVEDRALVMELVEGEEPRGPMPFADAWKLASQIAAALEYAHERGIIHRDLKPANVKVTPEGIVKLLDFGLAKAFTPPAPASGNPENSPTITLGATQMGVILGTAAYMAPEQAKGKTVDRRADIWAFGVVLYELLTGAKAFEGDDITDILAAVIKQEPNLDKAPAEALPLLRRCLEKDPKQRLRDIGDAELLLQRALPAVAATRTRRRWLWPALAAVGCAAAFALGAWVLLKPAPPPAVARFQIFAPAGSTIPLGTPAPSPDGRLLAYVVRSKEGVSRIHVRPIDSLESRPLPGTEDAIHPFWSPDGQSIGFAADDLLKRIDLAGGSPRILSQLTGPWHSSWSPSGVFLLAVGNEIMQVPAEGGVTKPAITPNQTNSESSSGFPYPLPDGDRILVRTNHTDGRTSIDLVTLGSGQRKEVLANVPSAPILAPTPAGKTYLLYLNDTALMAQEFDQKAGMVRGNPFALVDQIGRVASPAIRAAVGVSPAGVLAYQIATNEAYAGQLRWFDRSGKVSGDLPPDAVGNDPNLSPDGRFAAIVKTSATRRDIWVVDLARGSATRLSFSGISNDSPLWTADGKRVVYRGPGGIYIKEANGAGAEQVLIAGAGRTPRSLSPDGQYLLVNENFKLFLRPLTSGKAPLAAGSFSGVALAARISPDSKYLAFTSTDSGRMEVFVEALPPGAGKWQVSINGGGSPRWRGDGKELFFVTLDGKMMAADVTIGPAVSFGVPHELFRTPLTNALGSQFDVTADGQRFLIATPPESTGDAPITVVLNWWAGLKK